MLSSMYTSAPPANALEMVDLPNGAAHLYFHKQMDEPPAQKENDHHPPSSTMLGGEAFKNLLTENMQQSGLMRYHSAPSSLLANLVDMPDELFSPAGSSLNEGAADSEFARFFSEKVASSTTHFRRALSNGGAAPGEGSGQEVRADLSDGSRSMSQHSRFKRAAANEDANRLLLSAILEHGPELNSEELCGSNAQISVSSRQQGTCPGEVGSLRGSPGYASLPETKPSLVRHSSSPAGLLSRLATEVQSKNGERSPNNCFSGSLMHPPSDCLPERDPAARAPALVPAFPMRNYIGAGRVPGENNDDLATGPSQTGLLRQRSSPAGLLSQLNHDGLADDGLPTSNGESFEDCSYDRRGGSAFLGNYSWDESVAAANGASFAARKRIRESGDKYFAGSILTDHQQRDALEHGPSSANHFSMQDATSPENPYSPERLLSDYVPCRARAKRGCATHPRSIAERVRRTKISERMRRLQELVPNMDKQTNTADMLDEAVEYVKSLQRQVKELTENQPKCNGSCKQKVASPY